MAGIRKPNLSHATAPQQEVKKEEQNAESLGTSLGYEKTLKN